ncbi:MAG: large subunit ribosomal protein L33 [bacterium]|jgi:large subunit ribosomal protein L33
MSNSSRDIVQLECTECKRRNYSTTRNKKKKPTKIEVNKYCKFDKKHTRHKESK